MNKLTKSNQSAWSQIVSAEIASMTEQLSIDSDILAKIIK